MKLTVSNEVTSQIISIDVPESLTLQDLRAYIEAETDIEESRQLLIHNLKTLQGKNETLNELKIENDDIIILKQKTASVPSASTERSESSNTSISTSAVESQIEQLRQQFLNDPNARESLRIGQPEFYNALNNPQEFSGILKRSLQQMQSGYMPESLGAAQQEEIRKLEEDPDNPENQVKILEIIRQQQIQKNYDLAYEITPEAFTHVNMLYIKIKVNNKPVQAFVDSGAQQTIISPRLAQQVGIDRLIDKRFMGEAIGVGSSKIIGRIHSVPITIGDSQIEIPCSFTVLETAVDLLFGLDMLKRHRCKIDLETNKLIVAGGQIETPFLADHEIDNNNLLGRSVGGSGNLGFTNNTPTSSAAGDAALKRAKFGSNIFEGANTNASTTNSQTPVASTTVSSKFKDEDIHRLTGLGFSRQEVLRALEVCEGNVELAASFLFQ